MTEAYAFFHTDIDRKTLSLALLPLMLVAECPSGMRFTLLHKGYLDIAPKGISDFAREKIVYSAIPGDDPLPDARMVALAGLPYILRGQHAGRMSRMVAQDLSDVLSEIYITFEKGKPFAAAVAYWDDGYRLL